MTSRDRQTQSLSRLVTQFEIISLRQDNANIKGDYLLYGRLLGELQAVESELESLPNGLAALLPLLKSPNELVRYQVARLLVAIAHDSARTTLQQIADDKFSPYCLDACFTLARLDE